MDDYSRSGLKSSLGPHLHPRTSVAASVFKALDPVFWGTASEFHSTSMVKNYYSFVTELGLTPPPLSIRERVKLTGPTL